MERKICRAPTGWMAPLLVVGLVATGMPGAHAYLRPGVNRLVSKSSSGAPGNGTSGSRPGGGTATAGIAMSPDARFVVFESLANDLVPGDRNLVFPDVFFHDRNTGRTELISRGMLGLPPTFITSDGAIPVGSVAPSISADGRYVAFMSDATNLVSGDTNTVGDVFVFDRRSRETQRVSVSSAEQQANGTSMGSINGTAISSNGRYVAFNSKASNLVSGDTNGNCAFSGAPSPGNVILCANTPGWDTFVRDRSKGRTTRASVSSSEQQGDGDSEFAPSISSDGRFVVFANDSSALAQTGPYPCSAHFQIAAPRRCSHIYLRDRTRGRTELISVATDETPANNQSFLPGGQLVSASGRYVLFHSFAANLIPNDSPSGASVDPDLFVRDRVSGRTERVTVNSIGGDIGLVGCGDASISADGRFVSFGCPHPEFPGDGVLFVHDRATGTTETTSVGYDGREARQASNYRHSVLGRNGRYVAFSSNARDLVRGDDNATFDVFVRDRGNDLHNGGFLSAGGSAYSVTDAPGAVDALVVNDPDDDAVGSQLPDGELVGARLAYRPTLQDLYIRLDVAEMSGARLGVAASMVPSPRVMSYGVRFTVGDTRFLVRAAGPDELELLRCDPAGSCSRIDSLSGGYGTTGDSVVWTIPASPIGIGPGARIRDIDGFSTLGASEASGAAIIDEIAFTASD